MENFSISKKTIQIVWISNCNSCILMILWVKVFVSQGWQQAEIVVHKLKLGVNLILITLGYF